MDNSEHYYTCERERSTTVTLTLYVKKSVLSLSMLTVETKLDFLAESEERIPEKTK